MKNGRSDGTAWLDAAALASYYEEKANPADKRETQGNSSFLIGKIKSDRPTPHHAAA